VPVTVTVYTPSEPEQERFDVAELVKVTLVGFREHDSPVEGETAEARLTVPAKLLMLVTVTVEVAAWPGGTSVEVGDAEILKSFTVTAKLVE
jgi:hypothetical protein